MTRKTRGDAELKNLTDDQQAEVMRRLNAKGGTLAKVKTWLYEEWLVSVSLSQLSDFYSWYQLQQKVERAKQDATNLEEMAVSDFGLTTEQAKQLGNLHFMMRGIKSDDPKVYVAIAKVFQNDQRLQQNERKLDLEGRKLAILEKKAAQLDKVQDVMASNLTAEEQRERLREILK